MPVAVIPHEDFAGLVGRLAAFGPPAVPVPRPVVIPSLTFGDQLQRRVADRFGVCMGLEFLMPQDFIFRAVGPGCDSRWSTRRLAWQLLPLVDEFSPRLGIDKPAPRDALAVAQLLADRLDQYGHFRPELIRRWNSAAPAGAKPAAHEAWQRDLWRKLQEGIDEQHPALSLAAKGRDPGFRTELARKFPELLVLGTGSIDPLLVEVLGLLADCGAQVEVHVVLPTMGFLGDLKTRGRVPEAAADPEETILDGHHPLLESMGHHAAGSFVLLGKLDDQYSNWPAVETTDATSGALLGRLQADLRSSVKPGRRDTMPDDRSLQVHACHGPRREVEALRDELLRAFAELPGLRPEEIHIVAADFDAYAALIPAVLGQGDPSLPVQLTEHPQRNGADAAESLLALLELTRRGRCEAGEVLGLLNLPAVAGLLEVADVELPRRKIKESGFAHGTGGDQPGMLGFARDRLLAGRWLGDRQGDCYPDGQFALPVADALGMDPGLHQRLADWLLALEQTLEAWLAPAAAAQWAGRIEDACRALFAAGEESQLVLQPVLAFLREQDCPTPLDAGAILDWAAAELTGNARRARVTGKITFGRFKQLQNLPCRVLAMVGMQDGNFPAPGMTPAWDLLRLEPRIWDRNPRVDDRQLFLDGLLTPSDRLIVTANVFNPRSNQQAPFSSCVAELLRVVDAMGAGRPVIEHRLQPFSPTYFDSEGALPRSFSGLFRGVAETIRESRESAREVIFWDEAGGGKEDKLSPMTIGLGELQAFWKDPAQAFVRALGIRFARDDPPDEEFSRAPLELQGLGAWQVKNAILGELLAAQQDVVLLRRQLEANRLLPPGGIGDGTWRKNLETAAPLAETARRLAGPVCGAEVEIRPGIAVAGELRLTADGCALLGWRCGKLAAPAHFLAFWLEALLAAAAGNALPSKLVAEEHADEPLQTNAPDSAAAMETLRLLALGFQLGQSRPLRFGADASHQAAKVLEQGGSTEDAVAAARANWFKEDLGYGGGEALGEAARVAWRGRDPFDLKEEWIQWARALSLPLKKWGGIR